MKVGSSSVHLGSLPGVRRHLRTLRDDLEAGRCCTWVVPRSVAAGRELDQLLEVLGGGVHVVDVAPPPPARSLPSAVGTVEDGRTSRPTATRFGAVLDEVFGSVDVPLPQQRKVHAPSSLVRRILAAYCRFMGLAIPDTGDDPLVQLAEIPAAGTTVVVVRADQEVDGSEISGLLQRYPVLVREAGRRPPLLLVVGTPSVMQGLAPVDPLTTAAHWWWGVLGRLDVLTVATLVKPRAPHRQRDRMEQLSEDLVPEIIAEVAGPDLELAEHLGRDWDGTAAGLCQFVERVTSPFDDDARVATRSHAGPRPPQRLWEEWSDGRVAAWNGRTRIPLRHLTAPRSHSELRDRLWIGQARALNPVLDEVRRSLVDEVGRVHSAQVLGEVDRLYCQCDGFETIELNDLKKAADGGYLTIGGALRRLLLCARSTRNDLAHRRCVSDRKLWDLGELIAS